MTKKCWLTNLCRKEHVLVMLISILLWSAIFPCVFDISCFRFLVFLGAPFAFVAHLCTDRATLADRCPPHVPHRQKPYSARNYWKKIILLSISVDHIYDFFLRLFQLKYLLVVVQWTMSTEHRTWQKMYAKNEFIL